MARRPRSSPCALLRLFVAIILALFATSTSIWLWRSHGASAHRGPVTMPPEYKPPDPKAHPIDYLMKKGEAVWTEKMEKETKTLAEAAQAYRKRRGRHPPPGFAEWWSFAHAHDAVIVEDFFDQIYHDIAPFWGIEAKRIRQLARDIPTTINVRKGKATTKTDHGREWMDVWSDMTAEIQEWLPDVDIPINVLDESRVVVPWEDINNYVAAEQASRKLVPRQQALGRYTGLSDSEAGPPLSMNIDWVFREGRFWDTARVGCSPDSRARNVPAATDFSGPPPVHPGFPPGSFEGFVDNWTDARDPCQHPELRETHGTFIEPVSQATTHSLIPMFSGSKLPMNNDILIPPAMYWSDDRRFLGKDDRDWEQKESRVMWRGGATGGRNRRENWTRFQRHRFVSMMNETAVRMAEHNTEKPGVGANFVLQPDRPYAMTATQYMDLGTWLDRIADVGMAHLVCFPDTGGPHCPYTDHYFQVKDGMPLEQQFAYKILPDIDGNSFSGRYRSFLLSSSLPVKATIYSEWHDSRLVPWQHFVPMDNSFVDLYGILDYFLGTGVEFKLQDGTVITEGAHDEQAKKIAIAGKEWAERVLRREDMLIYYMRLLMEYARVSDDQRELLGFVDDVDDVDDDVGA